jgi:cytoskeletal protein CcmA (bactofilin family)
MAFNDLRKSGRSSEPKSAGGVGALTAFIDQGSEFSGKLVFKDTVRIDGQFEGEISSENTLIVGESGFVKAKIESRMVVISGEVRGDIRAPGQVTLHKTARVFGNVSTARLLVEEGAVLNGQVKMEAGGGVAASKEIPSPSPVETPKQQEGSKPNGKRAAV